jgi:CDP-diacylglycerol--glycerol-3-phosphate 3-phosphatidyltransferase
VLAQYCFSFLQVISTFSYKLLPPTSPTEAYHLSWPDTQTQAYDIQSKAATALSEFQSAHLALPSSENTSQDNVLVFPVIQAGHFDIREEETCLSLLFDHLATQKASTTLSPLMSITSGYFGLYKKYQDLILRSAVDCQIVAASPNVGISCQIFNFILICLLPESGEWIFWIPWHIWAHS